MENGIGDSFDLNFKTALDLYNGFLKAQCRIWNNSKYNFDDLYQECLLVTSHIVKHHSDLGIESRSFRNVLCRSVKNRLIDLQRRFSTRRRDRLLEVAYESSWDDDRLADAFVTASLPIRPDELIEAIQLAVKLEEKLNEIDRQMLRQLLDPCSELLKKDHEHEKAVREKAHRTARPAKTEIAVYLLGMQIGLNYKGAMASLSRIRRELKQLLSEN